MSDVVRDCLAMMLPSQPAGGLDARIRERLLAELPPEDAARWRAALEPPPSPWQGKP